MPVIATIRSRGREQMPILLPPQAEALIQQKVKSDLYANAEEAIDAAVHLLDEHDRRLARLRAAITVGEEGEALPWTHELMEQLSRDADEMLRRGEKPDPDLCP
jgi:putative addiction module CopG family antidote